MAAGEERDQELLHDFVLPDDHFGKFAANAGMTRTKFRDGLDISSGRRQGRVTASHRIIHRILQLSITLASKLKVEPGVLPAFTGHFPRSLSFSFRVHSYCCIIGNEL
jgi:hypothetical protein